MMCYLLACTLFLGLALAVSVPSVPLYNAAQPGQRIPVIGLGTGSYGTSPNGTNGQQWSVDIAEKATSDWLAAGGRRIDGSWGYQGQAGVGAALAKTNVSRAEIFVTSKLEPKGYASAMSQFEDILKELQVEYVDLLLIHFPGKWSSMSSYETFCGTTADSAKKCRQDTWRALEEIHKNKKALAIGVSNFEVNHLLDIFELNTTLPAVNQVETHLYFHEDLLMDFAKKHDILYNTYSPLGAPDHMAFNKDRWGTPLLQHPTVVLIAKRLQRTPAQVLLRWAIQQGLIVNPRTMNPVHMKENLSIFDFVLEEQDLALLSFVQHPTAYKVCDETRTIL